MALYFSALFVTEIALSSLNGLAFMLQLASGENMCKQKCDLNYFQPSLCMKPFQAT